MSELKSTTRRQLLILLSQIPVAALVGLKFWRGWDAVATIVAALLYEVVLIVWRFLRDVGLKSWAELRPELEAYLVSWVVGITRDVTSRFRRKLNRRTVEEFNLFNVRGLGLIHTFTLDLTDVFVDLRVTPTNPNAVRAATTSQLSGDQFSEGSSVWEFLREFDRQRTPRALAITGPPGSGKTTLLQHVAITFAANRQRRHRIRPLTPVFLFLREHAQSVVSDSLTLAEICERAFARSEWGLSPPKGWFQRQLSKGKILILLDGLDEVGNIAMRRKLSLWVDRQIAHYPRSRFVLSSRPQGYRDAPLSRAHVLEVLLLKPTQVERFVSQWYLANAIRSAGGNRDAKTRRRAAREADDLLRRLRAAPAIEELTSNPLLLTMVAMVHRYRGALPGSRAELYEEICEVLLGRWRQAKGIEEDLKTEQKRLVLQTLAEHMMRSRLRDISSAAALRVIAESLGRIGQEVSEQFLVYVQDSSGLLQEKEAGKWTFAHLTFQEYLTSVQWVRQRQEHSWREMVRDGWWHETLLLYASKSDATPIVRACLDEGTLEAFVLAAECLDEAAEVDVETRKEALQWLDLTLEAADDLRRRMAADVKLRRRAKTLQRLYADRNTRIDASFITCAEYEMFLSMSPGVAAPPHWIGRAAPAGDRRNPVGGISPDDAASFCRFVSLHDTTHAYYRLPTIDEADRVPGPSDRATWVTESGLRRLHGWTGDLRARIERGLREHHLGDEPLPPMREVGAFDYAIIERVTSARDVDRALKHVLDCTSSELFRGFTAALLSADVRRTDLPTLARNSAIELSRSRRESLDMTQTISRGLDQLGTSLTRHDFNHANGVLTRMETSAGTVRVTRMVRLLRDLVRTATAPDVPHADVSARITLARTLLYLYIAYSELREPAGIARFIAANYDRELVMMSETYWYLLAVAGWADGSLRTWDGIRFVRDFANA